MTPALLDALSDLDGGVATYVAQVLLVCRKRGMTFDQAWEAAMRSLPRPRSAATGELADWRTALRETRPAWRDCYEAPASAALVA